MICVNMLPFAPVESTTVDSEPSINILLSRMYFIDFVSQFKCSDAQMLRICSDARLWSDARMCSDAQVLRCSDAPPSVNDMTRARCVGRLRTDC